MDFALMGEIGGEEAMWLLRSLRKESRINRPSGWSRGAGEVRKVWHTFALWGVITYAPLHHPPFSVQWAPVRTNKQSFL